MATASPRSPSDASRLSPWRRRWAGRPWVLSLAVHAGLLVLLGLTLHPETPAGAPGQRTAEVGSALKQQDGQREYFTSEADSGTAQATATSAELSREALLAEHVPGNPGDVLPRAPEALGAAALGREGGGEAGGATQGPRARSGVGRAGSARVNVFGTQGEGFKFVYVFDRSTSMGGAGRTPLDAAKAELLGSLDSLDRTHQFQIVFYNERPWVFNPSGQSGRLAFGTDRNKEFARRFVMGITADGATEHEDALLAAIQLRPDVIFFLTDADEPRLSEVQLDKIARRASGIQINTIEFGFGPQQNADNFLVRLARLTGGQHAYVDVSQLGSR